MRPSWGLQSCDRAIPGSKQLAKIGQHHHETKLRLLRPIVKPTDFYDRSARPDLPELSANLHPMAA